MDKELKIKKERYEYLCRFLNSISPKISIYKKLEQEKIELKKELLAAGVIGSKKNNRML